MERRYVENSLQAHAMSWISIGTNQHQLYPFIQKSDLVSVFGARDLLIIVYCDSFKICSVRKPFKPGHRQLPTPAQTRMRMGRSSLYGFGLGFQLLRADLAMNSNCWFSMDVQLFTLMLRSRIQALLYSVSIRRPDQIENAYAILVSSSAATAAKDSDWDYCLKYFNQPSSHYWKPWDSTAPCLNWSCPVFDVCHHGHKICLCFLQRNLTYPALVLALLLIFWLLLTYSAHSASTAPEICDQRSSQRHPL